VECAIVSGIFFLAAELALVTGLLLARLRRVERRLSAETTPPDRNLALLQQSRPAPPTPFRWLRGDDGLGVFVPVLMGAGVLLSALAFVVQRVAETTTRITVEPSIARDLARLAPPAGGLQPDRGLPASPEDLVASRRGAGRRRAVVWLAVAMVAVALAWVGIDKIGDATQTRPESAEGVDTIAVIDASSRRDENVEAVVRALWTACRSRVPGATHLVSVIDLDVDRAVVVLEPGLGERQWLWFEGCVEDMTLTRVTASADRVERVGG
jgi:hypothetical protein